MKPARACFEVLPTTPREGCFPNGRGRSRPSGIRLSGVAAARGLGPAARGVRRPAAEPRGPSLSEECQSPRCLVFTSQQHSGAGVGMATGKGNFPPICHLLLFPLMLLSPVFTVF